MTLADDVPPEACLAMCAEVIIDHVREMTAAMPGVDDGPEDLARKYAILGRALRGIREYSKEGLKAVQIGSDSAAFLMIESGKHKPLSEFGDVEMKISVDGGSTVETTFGKFQEAAEKIIGGE